MNTSRALGSSHALPFKTTVGTSPSIRRPGHLRVEFGGFSSRLVIRSDCNAPQSRERLLLWVLDLL